MVNYYFQSMNGTISFVHAGTKEELREKVLKELGGDKQEAKDRIAKSIKEAEDRLVELQTVKPKTIEEELEDNIKIATLQKGIYDAKKEYERVDELMSKDLVFFELTPVDLQLDK